MEVAKLFDAHTSRARPRNSRPFFLASLELPDSLEINTTWSEPVISSYFLLKLATYLSIYPTMIASSRILVLLLTLLLLLFASTVVANVEISGKIESCSGWSLNKLRELKQFLKGGEAETFQNVEIKYIHGRKAVLTIFHDGEEHEKIELSGLHTRQEMHAMFLEKGFVKKSDEEIEAIRKQRQGEIQEEKDLAEAKRLRTEAIQFEKRTARQIRELAAEKRGTTDQDKRRSLEQEIKDKSQQIENRRDETRKRNEEHDMKEAKRLDEEAAQFEGKTAREIVDLEAERDGTNNPDKKRTLSAAMEDKSQQIDSRREETRKRTEDQEIRVLEAKRDRSKNPYKMSELEEEMEAKSQRIDSRREETRKRGEEIKKKLQSVHSEL